jgi:hypothetical protein
MRHIKSPNHYDFNEPMIFLAGSIEMGKAGPWQDELVEEFKDYPITFLNPRRSDWDSSWEQSIDNTKFAQQVNWELDGLLIADHVVFYFQPDTLSPISMMELGVCVTEHYPENLFVCCPSGFWRKGNVDILCARSGVIVYELHAALKETLAD